MEKRIEGDVVEEERSNGETKGKDPREGGYSSGGVLQVPRCESLHEVGGNGNARVERNIE